MGQALMRGLLAHGVPRRTLLAADPNVRTRSSVHRHLQLAVTDDNARVARRDRKSVV